MTQLARPPLRMHIRQALDLYLATIQHTAPAELNLHELVMQEVEPAIIEYVLNLTEGNKTQAALMLGLTRNTLRKKMERYCICVTNG